MVMAMGLLRRYLLWKYGIPDEDGLIPVWDRINQEWTKITLADLDKCSIVKDIKGIIARRLGVRKRDVKLPFRPYTPTYREAIGSRQFLETQEENKKESTREEETVVEAV